MRLCIPGSSWGNAEWPVFAILCGNRPWCEPRLVTRRVCVSGPWTRQVIWFAKTMATSRPAQLPHRRVQQRVSGLCSQTPQSSKLRRVSCSPRRELAASSVTCNPTLTLSRRRHRRLSVTSFRGLVWERWKWLWLSSHLTKILTSRTKQYTFSQTNFLIQN